MTRASLLQILDHVSEISDAEIRELEQLAAAFPYCQTAHILLAKAAHDRGSMLASQRLRRAATYATNRELLRQLLEQPAPVAATSAPTQPEVLAPALALGTITAENTTSAEEPAARPLEAVQIFPENQSEAPAVTESSSGEAVSDDIDVAVDSSALKQHTAEEASNLFEVTVPTLDEVTPVMVEPDQTTEIPENLQETDVQLPAEQPTETLEASASSELSAAEVPTEAPYTALQGDAIETAAPTGLAQAEAAEAALGDDLLPPTAPPIRPPANAGISRFEFDLVEPALPAPSAYRLPGLEEESEEEDFPLPTVSKTGPSAFHADKDLGYALGSGSRLGYDLQPHDGYTLDLPLDSFFEPDALLLVHIAASRPKPTKSSIDLINRFLQAQPRIKTATNDSKSADEQTDLSVRSTQAAPAIASESLAKIMVKQGKTDKAIEIYERLMQRQPEKKAYFADQIQQLKQPSA